MKTVTAPRPPVTQQHAAAALLAEFGLEGTRGILAQCPGNLLAKQIDAAVDDVLALAAL